MDLAKLAVRAVPEAQARAEALGADAAAAAARPLSAVDWLTEGREAKSSLFVSFEGFLS